MAAILSSKVKLHARSISLTSTSNPLIASIEERLVLLNSSSESTSSTSIFNKLRALKRLQECVNEFLHLPLTMQEFSNESNRKCVEQVLEGSVGLLDPCGATRDVFSQVKECVKELESSLRRNKRSLQDIKTYILQRKRLSKVVCKNLTRIAEKNRNSALNSSKDSNFIVLVQILKQVEETSAAVMESVLGLYSWNSKTRWRLGGFAIFSKILQSGNEIEKKMEVEIKERGKCRRKNKCIGRIEEDGEKDRRRRNRVG